jgi:hypothetical protein
MQGMIFLSQTRPSCLVAEHCWDRVRFALEEHAWRFERVGVPGALSTCRTRPREAAHEAMSGAGTSRIAPCLKRLISKEPVGASRDEMTRDGEGVVGGRVQGQEPLG